MVDAVLNSLLEYENIQEEKSANLLEFSGQQSLKLSVNIWNQFVSIKITEEIFTVSLLIFDSVKLLVLRCEQQIRIVQIFYICILTVSQFTKNRELKQLYRDVPLLCRTFVLCFSGKIYNKFFLSRTSFLNNFASCRPVETPVKVVRVKDCTSAFRAVVLGNTYEQ